MPLNTFNSTAEPLVPPAVQTMAVFAAGMVLEVAAFAVDPFGRSMVVLSWTLLAAGVLLALLPGPGRRVGTGLAFAGVAIPGVLFAIAWVWLSVAVLTGA